MTPEQVKSKELIEKFEALVPEEFGGMDLELAKQCALICAKEMIYELSDLPRIPYNERREQLWKSIKAELEKL